ncbi:class F sortase [bacterium]|nr:MAG: class F sortase [bacterium]
MQKSKILLKLTVVIMILLGIALFQLLLFHFGILPRKQFQGMLLVPRQIITGNQQERRSGLPIRLKIPKINVDTKLEYVGLTSAGSVGIPEDPFNGAWFDVGPRPGEKGNAIITGHFGWKNGISAVFDNLYKLSKGDKIYIEDAAGTTTVFVVTESRSYNPNAGASFVFISSDGKSHLNLITCEGTWNKSQKSYSKRLVIFSDKEEKTK